MASPLLIGLFTLFFAFAPAAEANELCRLILARMQHSDGIQKPVADIVVETTKEYAGRQRGNLSAPGYRQFAVSTSGGLVHYPTQVDDPRAQASAVWVFRPPDTEEENVWQQLSPDERTQVALGLEAPFAQGQFGVPILRRYLLDGTYGQPLVDEYKKLEPAPHRLLPFDRPEDFIISGHGNLGFSDLLFLRAAVNGTHPLGMCQHNCGAHTGLLYRLGAGPDDIEVRYGKRRDGGAFYHLYGALRPDPDNRTLVVPIDGVPDWKVSQGLRDDRDAGRGGIEKWENRFV